MFSHEPHRSPLSLLLGTHSHFGSHPALFPYEIAPFFSCTYELNILQPFCFQMYASDGVSPLSNKRKKVYPNGKRCRLPGLLAHSGYCLGHTQANTPTAFPVNVQDHSEDLSADLLPDLSESDSAGDINQFLARLLVLVTKGRVSPCRATVLVLSPTSSSIPTAPSNANSIHPRRFQPDSRQPGDMPRPAS